MTPKRATFWLVTVGVAALLALWATGWFSTVAWLVSDLNSQQPERRIEAVQKLGQMGPAAKAAIPALVECLADNALGYPAAVALRQIDRDWARSPTAAQAIPKLLQSAGQWYETDALIAEVLGKMGPAARPALTRLVLMRASAYQPVHWATGVALKKIDGGWMQTTEAHAAIPQLIDQLDDSEPGKCYGAARVLSEMKAASGAAVPGLLRLLRREDELSRATAARVLGEIGPEAPAAIPDLLRRSGDERESVQHQITEALELIDPGWAQAPASRAVVPELTEMVLAASRSPETVLRILNRIDPDWVRSPAVQQAVRTVVPDLDKMEPAPSSAAAFRLGRLGLAAQPALRALIERTEKLDTRYLRGASLSKIDPNWATSPAARAAVAKLIERLEDSNEQVRLMTVYALGEMGPTAQAAIPKLLKNHAGPSLSFDKAAAWARRRISPGGEPEPPAPVERSTVEELVAVGRGSIPELLARLQDPDSTDRYEIQQGLRQIDLDWATSPVAQAALPGLMKGLAHTEAKARAGAALALGAMGIAARESLPALIERLDDMDERVRASARIALNGLGPAAEGAFTKHVERLGDPDPKVRREAAYTLDALDLDWGKSAAVRAALVKLMVAWSDRDENVHSATGSVLRKIDPNWEKLAEASAAVPRLLANVDDKDIPVRRAACCALVSLGPVAQPAVEKLIQRLADADPVVRKKAAQALGRIGPGAEKAVPQLIDRLADKNAAVVLAAGVAVAILSPNSPQAQATVTRLVGLLDMDVDMDEVVDMLRRIGAGAKAAVPKLIKMLSGNPHTEVAKALTQIDPNWRASAPARARVDELLAGLNRLPWELRLETRQRLAQLDPEWTRSPAVAEMVPKFTVDLDARDPRTRQQATLALGVIGLAAESTIPRLIERTYEPDPWTRSAAVWAIGRMGTSGAVALPVILERLDDSNHHVRIEAATVIGRFGPAGREAVPRLAELLADVDDDRGGDRERAALAEALGEIGPEASAAITALVLLTDLRAHRDNAGEAAANALWKIDPHWAKDPRARDAIPALIARLTDPRRARAAAHTLARIDPNWSANESLRRTLPRLVDRLHSREEDSRRLAAEMLGKMGPAARSAGPNLIDRLGDADPSVRAYAAIALGAIGPDAKAAIPRLTDMLSDREEWPRKAAAQALRTLRR